MPVSIQRVSKTYNRYGTSVDALDDVSLNIPDGQFVSLVGPSGCGKSTLLSLVGGLETLSRGQISRTGQPAIVFQEAALFPWRTVLDNVAFGLQLRGVGKRERRDRAASALRMVHLARFAEAYPYELSGGMRQRAAIARALVLDPTVLLMDEPFGALDAQTRALLQDELLSVWERTRKTVLFVTHSLDEALILSDRVVLFSARPGRIVADVAVEAPRPRDTADPPLAALQRHLRDLLAAEVEKVARAEMDADWEGAAVTAPSPEQNVGADI